MKINYNEIRVKEYLAKLEKGEMPYVQATSISLEQFYEICKVLAQHIDKIGWIRYVYYIDTVWRVRIRERLKDTQ